MNRKYVYIVLVLVVTSALFYAEKYVDKENEHYPEVDLETKVPSTSEFNSSYLPSSTTGAVVFHAYYTLSYSEKHEQAEWVAYEVSAQHLSKNEFKRPYFIQDRDVKSGSADWRNYKKSGYDRGHLCPAGARRFNYDAFHETFLTSNISPQDHGFNSGVWNRLEQKVRYWAKQYDGVYVITGGVLENGLKGIGEENVSVPNEFYKIVLDNSNGTLKALAFLIPNEDTSKSFYDFAVPIDEIEAKTGLDFLKDLAPSEEKTIESSVNLKAWGKR